MATGICICFFGCSSYDDGHVHFCWSPTPTVLMLSYLPSIHLYTCMHYKYSLYVMLSLNLKFFVYECVQFHKAASETHSAYNLHELRYAMHQINAESKKFPRKFG